MKKLLTAIVAVLATHSALAGVKIENWVSPGGARVFFVESRVLPMLDVQVDFAAGSMFDPPGKSGTAALTRSVLGLGAGKLDETAIAEQMADIGATLGGGADTDRASVAVRTLATAEKRDAALAVLRTVLHAPRFEAAIFEREKGRRKRRLQCTVSSPWRRGHLSGPGLLWLWAMASAQILPRRGSVRAPTPTPRTSRGVVN